ncbi:MAG: NUDIX hydrolase [Polyangiaceae bacterium]|nr:NUDIX hydrolase [Polyangiaceae bacterium]
MTSVLLPQRVKKLEISRRDSVADYGMFRVERLAYPMLPRDVFIFACSDWCNVVAETSAGELVFVWQYRFGTDALSLEVPGGVIDPSETPEEAARRELREETGYEAESFELLSVVEPNPPLQGNRCFTYLARGAKLTGTTAFDELEDLEVLLVPKGSVEALITGGDVTHALAVVAIESYLRMQRDVAPSWNAIEQELEAIEKLQKDKVFELARRLKPGLTMEDIQNPHDFPELGDPDWHYADGILTGIQSVMSALRAMRNRYGGAHLR